MVFKLKRILLCRCHRNPFRITRSIVHVLLLLTSVHEMQFTLYSITADYYLNFNSFRGRFYFYLYFFSLYLSILSDSLFLNFDSCLPACLPTSLMLAERLCDFELGKNKQQVFRINSPVLLDYKFGLKLFASVQSSGSWERKDKTKAKGSHLNWQIDSLFSWLNYRKRNRERELLGNRHSVVLIVYIVDLQAE